MRLRTLASAGGPSGGESAGDSTRSSCGGDATTACCISVAGGSLRVNASATMYGCCCAAPGTCFNPRTQPSVCKNSQVVLQPVPPKQRRGQQRRRVVNIVADSEGFCLTVGREPTQPAPTAAAQWALNVVGEGSDFQMQFGDVQNSSPKQCLTTGAAQFSV